MLEEHRLEALNLTHMYSYILYGPDIKFNSSIVLLQSQPQPFVAYMKTVSQNPTFVNSGLHTCGIQDFQNDHRRGKAQKG